MTVDDCDADSLTSDTAEGDAPTDGRLTTAMVLGAAWALDKLINRIGVINLLTVNKENEIAGSPEVRVNNDAPNDSRDKTLGKAMSSKTRVTVRTMLERTAQELRSSATYDTLRNANKSMSERRRLIKEHSTNRNAVEYFRDATSRHRTEHEVGMRNEQRCRRWRPRQAVWSYPPALI